MTPNTHTIITCASLFAAFVLANLTLGYYFENRSLRFDLQLAKDDVRYGAKIAEEAKVERELCSTRLGFYRDGGRQ